MKEIKINVPEHHGRLFILDANLMKQYFVTMDCSNVRWISEVGVSLATIRIVSESEESEVKK